MTKIMITPHGVRIVGSLENVPGTCAIADFDDRGEPNYEGGTDVDWDGQKTVERDGSRVFVDEDGDEYLERDCKLIDEDVFAFDESGEDDVDEDARRKRLAALFDASEPAAVAPASLSVAQEAAIGALEYGRMIEDEAPRVDEREGLAYLREALDVLESGEDGETGRQRQVRLAKARAYLAQLESDFADRTDEGVR